MNLFTTLNFSPLFFITSERSISLNLFSCFLVHLCTSSFRLFSRVSVFSCFALSPQAQLGITNCFFYPCMFAVFCLLSELLKPHSIFSSCSHLHYLIPFLNCLLFFCLMFLLCSFLQVVLFLLFCFFFFSIDLAHPNLPPHSLPNISMSISLFYLYAHMWAVRGGPTPSLRIWGFGSSRTRVLWHEQVNNAKTKWWQQQSPWQIHE